MFGIRKATFKNAAQTRRTDLTDADFAALDKNVYGNFYVIAPPEASLRTQIWNKYIPLSFNTAHEMLSRDLGDNVVAGFPELYKNHAGWLRIERSTGDRHIQLSDHRFVNFKDALVGSGTMSVTAEAQGAGLGRHLLRNQIEFFHACKMRRFEIIAGSENGGYTWARFGFTPARGVLPLLSSRLRERFNVIADALDSAQAAALEKRLNLRRGTDLWAIADMDGDVTEPVRQLSARWGGDENYPPRPAANEEEQGQRTRVTTAFNRAVKTNRPLTVGRAMLVGMTWHGALDYNSRTQMRRVSDYCGGLNYIKL